MDNFLFIPLYPDTKCNFVARRRKRLDAVEVVIHLFRDTSRECCDDLEMSHVT